VDDDEDLQKLLSYEFRELGFEVQSFKAGETALEFLLNPQNLEDVFLLILDRMLPDMDGLDILQQFNEKSPVKVPVLILSVLSKENDIIAGLQGGAVDYIPKPFSVFMLMQKALNMLKAQTA
jgi:two-component system phosphate regulon response regulator PhoB